MFTEEERVKLINQVIENELDFLTGTNVTATFFNGLLVNYAKEIGANLLIRGIRSVSDFEYEINLANINKTIAPGIETVFLPTSPDLAVVSSSAAKEIAKYEGDITKFVPSYVAKAVIEKFGFVKFGGSKCSKCGTSSHLKMTDDKPSFLFCRLCGVVVENKEQAAK